ncbi:MAG: DUF86 domain-containing protein [Rickettsiales bacterium]|nr:DUF86 domain-containing protein [Rickettsiales bacterium]
MAKNYKLYLLHVLNCIEKINVICNRGDISEDFVLYDACLRNLQTLSESTNHFPEEIKIKYSQINWKGISGFRNILVHDYLGDIDPETVKKIISDYLPELDKVTKSILEE